MAIFGSISTVRSQISPTRLFAESFAYLEELFRPGSAAAIRMKSLSVGTTERIELSGGAFALEQVYRSKPRAEGFFEAHRKFIDLQVVFEGEEWMEVVDLQRCRVKHPYDAQRDFTVYEDVDGSMLLLKVGDAAVFDGSDVHMPGLCGTLEPSLVRKSVIKVPVGLR